MRLLLILTLGFAFAAAMLPKRLKGCSRPGERASLGMARRMWPVLEAELAEDTPTIARRQRQLMTGLANLLRYYARNQRCGRLRRRPKSDKFTPPPTTTQPWTSPPAAEPQTTQPPATEAPTTQPPSSTEPPAIKPATTEPPTTRAPTTQPPATTEPPATKPETTKPSTTQALTMQPPRTQPPAAQPPTAELLATQSPTAQPSTSPTTARPPTTEPPTTQPSTAPPATQPETTQPSTSPPATQPTTTQPESSNVVCLEPEKALYSGSFMGHPSVLSPEDCCRACRDYSGARACRSFNFDLSAGKCGIFSEVVESGSEKLRKQSGWVHGRIGGKCAACEGLGEPTATTKEVTTTTSTTTPRPAPTTQPPATTPAPSVAATTASPPAECPSPKPFAALVLAAHAPLSNPPTPFIHPVRLIPGRHYLIQGVASDNFRVDFRLGPNKGADIAYHFNPRFTGFGYKAVSSNSRKAGTWGSEKLSLSGEDFPFVPGVPFAVEIRVDKDAMRVSVDGKDVVSFTHRMPIGCVSHLTMVGYPNPAALNLTKVDVSFAPPKASTNDTISDPASTKGSSVICLEEEKALFSGSFMGGPTGLSLTDCCRACRDYSGAKPCRSFNFVRSSGYCGLFSEVESEDAQMYRQSGWLHGRIGGECAACEGLEDSSPISQ